MKINVFKPLLLLCIFVGCLFILAPDTKAQGKYSYYLSYFYNIGYDTRLPFLKTHTIDEKAALTKTVIADRFSLLFSSLSNPDFTLAHSNIFFICDVPYQLEGHFSCSSDSVTAPDSNKHLLFHDTYLDEDIYIYEIKYLHKNLVIIPESYLVNDLYKNKITAYFNARYELDLERLGYVDKRLPTGISQQYVEKLLELPIEKYGYQLLVMIVFLSALLLLFSESFSKFINFYSMYKVKGIWLVTIARIRGLRYIFAAVFLTAYAFLLYRYSMQHPSADIYEVLVYSLVYLEPVIARGSVQIDFLRVFLVCVSLITLGLLMITQALFYFSNVTQNLHFAAKRFHLKNLWVVISVISLSGLVILSLEKSNTNFTAHSLLLLVLLVWFIVYIPLSSRTHIEPKAIEVGGGLFRYFLLLFCILSAFCVLSIYSQSIKRPYKTVPLFSQETVLLLPQELEVEDKSIYAPLRVKGNIPLFVNDYLIYYPKYKKIRNVALSKFSDVRSYIIVAPKETDTLVQHVLSNTLVRDTLLTDDVASNLVYLKIPDTIDRSKIQLEVSYDCRILVQSHSLNIKPYYFDKYSGDFLSNMPRINVLSFPGCDKSFAQKNQNNLLTYRFGLDLSEYNSNELVFRLNGIIWQKISGMRFVSKNAVLESHFVRNVENETILVSKLAGGGVLTSYSFENSTEFSIDDVPSVTRDIAKVINEMIHLGLVGDNFILQSLTSGSILNIDL